MSSNTRGSVYATLSGFRYGFLGYFGITMIHNDFSVLSVLEPLFIVILGVILLGEKLPPAHLVGVIIVLSGALLTLFSERISFKVLTAK